MFWSEVCPVCGNPEPNEEYDVCQTCSWERDYLMEKLPDYCDGKSGITLNIAKANYQDHGHIGKEP